MLPFMDMGIHGYVHGYSTSFYLNCLASAVGDLVEDTFTQPDKEEKPERAAKSA